MGEPVVLTANARSDALAAAACAGRSACTALFSISNGVGIIRLNRRMQDEDPRTRGAADGEQEYGEGEQ